VAAKEEKISEALSIEVGLGPTWVELVMSGKGSTTIGSGRRRDLLASIP